MKKKIASLALLLAMLATFVPYYATDLSTVSAASAATAASALQVTSQPRSVTAPADTLVTFTVKASGVKLSYQWQLSDDNGKTWRNSKNQTDTYITTLTAANNGRALRCVMTDKYGNSVKSNAAYMRLANLSITEQPVSVTAKNGDLVTFRVKAVGSELSYQWQLSDDKGKTWRDSKIQTPTYAAILTTANSTRYVRCIITDGYGNSVKSNAAYMKVSSLKITGQPSSVSGKKGDLVTFKVTANGPGITYQWQLSDDKGLTWRNSKIQTATYTAVLSDGNNGRYVHCVVTDKYGNSVKSHAAMMSITGTEGITADANGTVWVTATGSKYHSTSTCSGMKNPMKVTLEHAKEAGYTACQKCW